MISEQFRSFLVERKKMDDETQGNWAYGNEQYWKRETELLSADIAATIDFILTECTDDEFFWMSEVFDDVAAKTQSRAFVDALYRRYEKLTPKENFPGVLLSIEYADGALEPAEE